MLHELTNINSASINTPNESTQITIRICRHPRY